MTANELAAAALAAVTERGYRDCDDRQFVARNLCKATEELAECGAWILDPSANGETPPGPVDAWLYQLSTAGSAARAAFDNWTDVLSITPANLAAELADAMIPLLCAAAVLGVDVEAAVLAKCRADVARGVR